MKKIEVLVLDDNKLTVIPPETGRLANLKALYLQGQSVHRNATGNLPAKESPGSKSGWETRWKGHRWRLP